MTNKSDKNTVAHKHFAVSVIEATTAFTVLHTTDTQSSGFLPIKWRGGGSNASMIQTTFPGLCTSILLAAKAPINY
jgi:hypothetical protein